MICDAEFGRKLRVFRELKNISREKFADLVNQKLYYTKASNNYFTAEKVYYFEMGKRQFTATFLMICCKILDINIQWFYEDLAQMAEDGLVVFPDGTYLSARLTDKGRSVANYMHLHMDELSKVCGTQGDGTIRWGYVNLTPEQKPGAQK